MPRKVLLLFLLLLCGVVDVGRRENKLSRLDKHVPHRLLALVVCESMHTDVHIVAVGVVCVGGGRRN